MDSDTNKKKEDKKAELITTKYLVEALKQMQAEVENLKLEIRSIRRIPSGKIGITFIVPGVLALVFSILNDSNVLAFIGLGLTFWGALFFFVRPIRYVQSSLLDSTAISTYTTLDRIVKDLRFHGKGYYIPPYPKEVYLPEYLKGLKETVVFISADEGGIPSVEELAKSKFLLKNPNGICVTPPGLGLLAQFENELRRDLTGFQLNELCENLPQLMVESLQLAKDVEIKEENNCVYLKILDSAFKGIYTKNENLMSVHFLGCPLVSAIACAIAKATGKIVTIQKDKISSHGQTIEVWYRFEES